MTGLKNQYVTHGLGVPLIAIRRGYPGEPAAAKYYPPGLSFPVTAFLRPLSQIDPQTGQAAVRNQCVLELYDPLSAGETLVAGRHVPLESDLTTPLAYFLSRPELDMATAGLLHPEALLAPRPQDSLLALAARPARADHGPVHGAALRAGQDSGADGPRAVVQPDDLDGDVQRPAEPARRSGTTINSGSISIRRASRSG